MAISDLEATPQAVTRRKWPLAAVLWFDLALIALLVIGLSFVVQSLVIRGAAAAQGISAADLKAMSETQLLGLYGVRGAFVTTLVQNLLFLGVPILRVGRIRREPLASIGYSARNWPVTIVIGLGVGAVALFTNLVLGALFAFGFGLKQDQAAQFGALLKQNDFVGQALFALLAVVIAPIGEEALFRGYLFNGLRQGGGRTRLVVAYALSAAIFAAVHLSAVTQGQLALIVPIFVVGLILAATMHLTGSLIPCIIAHAVHNSLSTLVLIYCINSRFPGCPI